jgi:GNAT superfamily N-acetyltransferase
MTDLPENVVLRPVRESDLNFIRSSWLKSYRPLYTMVPNPVYYAVYHGVVEGLLARPTSRTVVACASDHDDHILGYACAEPTEQRFHWAYVKEPFRRIGIGRALVRDALVGAAPGGGVIVTHTLPDGIAKLVVGEMGWSVRPALAMFFGLVARHGVKEEIARIKGGAANEERSAHGAPARRTRER